MASPDERGWAAVRDAVDNRMQELGIGVPALAQESGLSETTIRYIGRPNGGRRTYSVLVALSAALGWPYDHLRNVLEGHPDSSIPVPRTSARQAALLEKLDEEIADLKSTLRTVELLVGKLRNS